MDKEEKNNISNNRNRLLSAKERNKRIANRLGTEAREYTLDHKCFGLEEVPVNVKKSKQYIKNIINPDILELKPKAWNPMCRVTTEKSDFEDKKDLDKILFEVKNGLADVQVVDLIEPLVYPGTEVRDIYYFLWNNSTKLERKDFNELYNKV